MPVWARIFMKPFLPSAPPLTKMPAHLPSALYFQCLTVNYFIREAFGLAAYFVYGG